MRKQFWFIGLFGIWCLFSALWYFFNVKGVTTTPETFRPQLALVAILEILTMLLVACLLGYAIAWWMQGETIERQSEKLESLQGDNRTLAESAADVRKELELWKEKLHHDLNATQQKSAALNTEKEKLQKINLELESSLREARQEMKEARTNTKEENELGTLRYRIRQLEFQLKDSEESLTKQQHELESLMSKKEHISVSDHPFVRPVEPDEKDDLTKIKGIGPFIEKRLNMIGIYTFQHLSELSPEMIDRVGAAIEFFPHRIIKDDWVGQARSFGRF